MEFDPEREIHLNSRMCTPRETLDGIPNSDGDKMQGSSALSQLQGLTDEREQGNFYNLFEKFLCSFLDPVSISSSFDSSRCFSS